MKKLGLFVIPIKVDSSISTYNDYLDFLVEAEEKGYTNIYIGEHLTDEREDIQSSLIFAAALLAKTRKIKVCLCVLPLPHYEIKLLSKQLEDLYRLSKGRLEIGFSQGALKSDAEYIGFDHSRRSLIFSEKLDLLMREVNKSNYLNKIPKSSFCSTLLSPMPIRAANLFDNGHTAITSNFVNELYWENHIRCLIRNQNTNLSKDSKWHICLNIVPKNSNNINTNNIIKESLFYIFEKLNNCNLNVMLKNKNQSSIAKEKLIEILFEDLTYEILPERYFLLKSKYSKYMGHIIVNLFDCINDSCYRRFIMELPRDARFCN